MIILAAGQGTRLRPLTDDRPKCLVNLAGLPLLKWQIQTAHAAGIRDIVVVGGYRAEQLQGYGIQVIENPNFASTNMVCTLFCASHLFGTAFVMSYGDIVYTPDVLRRVIGTQDPIAVTVDREWRAYWELRFEDPLSDAETLALDAQGNITDIGQKTSDITNIAAQYIGLVSFRGPGVSALRAVYDAAVFDDTRGHAPFVGKRILDQLYMTDLLQGLIHRGDHLKAVMIQGGWLEIDSIRDLALAEELVAQGRLGSVCHG